MNRFRKLLISLALCGLTFTLASCGSSDSTVPVSVNAATWSNTETNEITQGCMDSEGSPSRTLCQCISTGITSAYSKSEWDQAYKVMSESGQATQAYMDVWNNCDVKFGTASDQPADGPTQEQLEQYNYPTCVQVLAPGNSGLSLADNDTELGRPDRQPGYCILPNSGGEKYYYQGRR
ncbi:MAG: hypothetical protein RLZZ295_418 [Actinomycetota bacterium]|jgi:hypothetical protein